MIPRHEFTQPQAVTFELISELVSTVFKISVLADAMDRFNGRNRGSGGGGGGGTHGDVFRRVSRMSRRSFRCGNLFCQIDGRLEMTLLKVDIGFLTRGFNPGTKNTHVSINL